jgi:hypothetical protein
MAQYLVFSALIHFFPDFQLFRPEYNWRDLISLKAHLVHQNLVLHLFYTYKDQDEDAEDISNDEEVCVK